MAMLSDLLRRKLIDERGREARLGDLAVDLSAGDYPPVTYLTWRLPGKTQLRAPWGAVRGVRSGGRVLRLDDLEGGEPVQEDWLAQAVLLVCYELRMAALARTPTALPRARRHAPAAGVADLQDLFQDVERTLEEIDFFKKRNPAAILRTVRAVTRRAGLDAREARLFRAMAIEVRKVLDRVRGAKSAG